jgi:hypothetical protein
MLKLFNSFAVDAQTNIFRMQGRMGMYALLVHAVRRTNSQLIPSFGKIFLLMPVLLPNQLFAGIF